jgi:hypothetical protein
VIKNSKTTLFGANTSNSESSDKPYDPFSNCTFSTQWEHIDYYTNNDGDDDDRGGNDNDGGTKDD